MLRLTLLAPDIIEAILDGLQPKGLGLPEMMETLSVEWSSQRRKVLSGQFLSSDV